MTANLTEGIAKVSELFRLNGVDAASFTGDLGDLFEHSPWVAELAAPSRPFATARLLHTAMLHIVREAGEMRQLALIRAHPELAGKEAVAGTMTDDSLSEQSRLGLTRLAREDFDRLSELNRRYRELFGFPCIIALRRHSSLASLLAAFEQRLAHSRDTEIKTAISEIEHITEGRLAQRLGLADGRLSTHVLDTTTGLPGVGMAFRLSIARAGAWERIADGQTNAHGRTDQPLVTGLDMVAGTYRLEFQVADYFRKRAALHAVPPFLDIVPIEFGIADPGQHYHVPLLCTPWSYSTYRGS